MDQQKLDKIISCYGNMKQKSVATVFNVSRPYVHNVWLKAGCYEEEI